MARKYNYSRFANARLLALTVVVLLGTSAVQGQLVDFPSAAPSAMIEEALPTSDAPSSVPSPQTCVPVGGKCETDFECCDHQEETFCSVTCKARFQDSTKDETKLYQEDNPRGSLTRRALKGSSMRKGY